MMEPPVSDAPRWKAAVTLQERIWIPAPSGGIAAVVHRPERIPAPVVICCHGLMSSKDSSKFVSIGERFSLKGLAVVRFDFCGCGETETPHEESLIHSRLRDLDRVVRFVSSQTWADGRLGLLGSSLGGYLALLLAAGSASPLIDAVVCWSTPFDLTRIRIAMDDGELLARELPEGFSLGTPETLENLAPVPRVLIVHGQQDETVPWRQAAAIHQRLEEPKRLVFMADADHRLLDPLWRQAAMELSLRWFSQCGFGPD